MCCYLMEHLPKSYRRGVVGVQNGFRTPTQVRQLFRLDLEYFLKGLPNDQITEWFKSKLDTILKTDLEGPLNGKAECERKFLHDIIVIYEELVPKLEKDAKESLRPLLEWHHDWELGRWYRI